MSEKTNLAVVIPCYNEEQNVEIFNQELLKFKNLWHEKYSHLGAIRFYIVNNNSTDSTLKKLKELEAIHKDLIIILDCGVQGYGAALRRGFSEAKDSRYLSFLDFDNTYPLESLPALLEQLIQNSSDIVYGVRLHSNSQIETIRYWGNYFYVLLLKALFRYPLSDACSGMRVFRGELVSEVLSCCENDLSFSIELTVKALANNWKFNQLPINYRGRTGDSKLHVVRDGFKFLYIIFRGFFARCVK